MGALKINTSIKAGNLSPINIEVKNMPVDAHGKPAKRRRIGTECMDDEMEPSEDLKRLKDELEENRKALAIKEKENMDLRAKLKQSIPIELIDLTNEETAAGEGKNPHLADKPKSYVATVVEHMQALVQVKREAIDRARDAEEKAANAEEQKKNILFKLECPICFEVKEQSYAMVPCGHVLCGDCNRNYVEPRCHACRGKVVDRLQLYK